MGDRERRKKKLRDRKAKERRRQERRQAKAADALARELAEEEKLFEQDRKILEAERPTEAQYEAKLALLRSTKLEDRERFLDDLADDPDKFYNLDDLLDIFAWDLTKKTSDEVLRTSLQDPDLDWFELIEAVERAGLVAEADLLRFLVRAAEYPVTREEREEEVARRRASYEAAQRSRETEEATGPSAVDFIAALAPLSSGAGRFRPRS
jgi:hypothetical protein